jgi:hypothetical protein
MKLHSLNEILLLLQFASTSNFLSLNLSFYKKLYKTSWIMARYGGSCLFWAKTRDPIQKIMKAKKSRGCFKW